MGERMVPLKDVLTVVNGKNQRAVENPSGKYPIYGSGGVMGHADEYICDADAVIIGRKGNINNPIYVTEPFWNVDTAFGLVADKSKLLPKYLYHFCRFFDFERLNSTVTIPSLTKRNLQQVEIPLPELDTQQAVVNLLDGIEAQIDLAKQMLAKTDELIQSRFVEIFGDPLQNDNFEQKKLEEICDIKIGPFGSALHKEDYITGGHCVINPMHIIDETIQPDESFSISDTKYEELESYHLKNGDLVLGRRGEIGRCGIVHEEGLLCGTGSMILRHRKVIRPIFLQHVITCQSMRESLERRSVGVTMKNLNAKTVGMTSIALPPLALQNEFAEFVTKVEELKSATQAELDRLNTLYDSLAQRYFA